jgi:hypothetical protein
VTGELDEPNFALMPTHIEPEPQPDTCRCPNPGTEYLLEIDAGHVVLTHTACGLQPDGDWWAEALQLDVTPVQVAIESDCNGNTWHGLQRCECDSWAQITLPGADS